MPAYDAVGLGGRVRALQAPSGPPASLGAMTETAGTPPRLRSYMDGFPAHLVRLAAQLHAVRQSWVRHEIAEDADAGREFGDLDNLEQLAWLRIACIVADDESLKLANDIPDLHATAYNVIVNQGGERMWKKLRSLRDSINRSRDAFERTLNHLHGKVHIPHLRECRIDAGGAFCAEDCPHHHSHS